MWVRYPVAVLVSYSALLGLIRIWVEIERRRFDPDEADLRAEPPSPSPASDLRRGGGSSWFDWLDLGHFGFPDLDEGCLAAVLFIVLGLLLVGLVMIVAAAQALLAEIFLDAFIVSVLYRRLRIAQKEDWLGTALRKTVVPALITAILLGLGGRVLEESAPGAHSIGKAIKQIRSDWKEPGRPQS
jgi:hypothetical protein